MQFLPELVQTKDGKSSREGKPDQSESANGVEAQLGGGGGGGGGGGRGGGGSRAGCIKKTDPYKGTGANNQWEMKCVYKRHLIPI